MSVLARGIKSGFTLIEVLVVMVLIGIMATIFVPNMLRLAPGYKRKEFITSLNGLLGVAWQNGLKTGEAHRLYFDLDKREVRVEIDTGKEKAGDPVFEQVPAQFIVTSFTMPEILLIKQFYIEGEEKLQRAGIKTQAIWFYIAADGLAQDVIINMVDMSEEDAEGNAIKFGLVINPFTVQLKDYEEFQKP